MSETTPDSTTDATEAGQNDPFAASETEPSMEDILASIRKIIADDADPVPLEGPIPASTAEPTATEATVVDLPPADFQPAVEARSASDEDALDLDALLTEMDVIEPDTLASADATMGSDEALSELEDILAIPDPEPEAPIAAADDSDDMDRLMSELLVGLDDELPPVNAHPVDPTSGDVSVPASDVGAGEDMDLVKSLMADLTDDDMTGAVQTQDDLIEADAALSIPSEPVTDDDAILDSILNMTLEDEIAALERKVEAEASAQNAASAPVETIQEPASDSSPSLADIAAAAEADAQAHTPDPEPDEGAAVTIAAGAALLGGAALAAKAEPVETPAVRAEAPSEPQAKPKAKTKSKPPTAEVEPTMPSALRSDAILDDVTEEAAMSAFAELNQVVEEKAVFNERGPRIGDLVQEALKPMLKEWLDANLKGIVERAVAKEVKRISTGK